jgi:putative addiction module component (TIGR02574 family)
MTTNVQELLQTALRLPENERADLAASLIESLDQPFDSDARDAWAEEVRRRVSDLDAGTVRAIPWGEARATIAGRFE